MSNTALTTHVNVSGDGAGGDGSICGSTIFPCVTAAFTFPVGLGAVGSSAIGSPSLATASLNSCGVNKKRKMFFRYMVANLLLRQIHRVRYLFSLTR